MANVHCRERLLLVQRFHTPTMPETKNPIKVLPLFVANEGVLKACRVRSLGPPALHPIRQDAVINTYTFFQGKAE